MPYGGGVAVEGHGGESGIVDFLAVVPEEFPVLHRDPGGILAVVKGGAGGGGDHGGDGFGVGLAPLGDFEGDVIASGGTQDHLWITYGGAADVCGWW